MLRNVYNNISVRWKSRISSGNVNFRLYCRWSGGTEIFLVSKVSPSFHELESPKKIYWAVLFNFELKSAGKGGDCVQRPDLTSIYMQFPLCCHCGACWKYSKIWNIWIYEVFDLYLYVVSTLLGKNPLSSFWRRPLLQWPAMTMNKQEKRKIVQNWNQSKSEMNKTDNFFIDRIE